MALLVYTMKLSGVQFQKSIVFLRHKDSVVPYPMPFCFGERGFQGIWSDYRPSGQKTENCCGISTRNIYMRWRISMMTRWMNTGIIIIYKTGSTGCGCREYRHLPWHDPYRSSQQRCKFSSWPCVWRWSLGIRRTAVLHQFSSLTVYPILRPGERGVWGVQNSIWLRTTTMCTYL